MSNFNWRIKHGIDPIKHLFDNTLNELIIVPVEFRKIWRNFKNLGGITAIKLGVCFPIFCGVLCTVAKNRKTML